MSKPTVFFSHSSRDQQSLVRLKDLFIEKTGGAIDVFLSSDGQSIPLGRNWVHRIEKALEDAKIMVIFVTPGSLRSNWIFFESGFAYAKDKRVVPVGFLGVDLATISPPLSLLQGFNIKSEDGLNNLIALANEEFGHSHAAKFSKDEYGQIVASSDSITESLFGERVAMIDRLGMSLTKKTGLNRENADATAILKDMLEQEGIHCHVEPKGVHFHGVTVTDEQNSLYVDIEPTIAAVTFPVIGKWLEAVRSDGFKGIALIISFRNFVRELSDLFKVSGRLYNCGVVPFNSQALLFREIEFETGHHSTLNVHSRSVSRGISYLRITPRCNTLPTEDIRQLLNLLFEREVLYIADDAV